MGNSPSIWAILNINYFENIVISRHTNEKAKHLDNFLGNSIFDNVSKNCLISTYTKLKVIQFLQIEKNLVPTMTLTATVTKKKHTCFQKFYIFGAITF